MRAPREVIQLLRRERGVALPVAMAVLLLTTALAAIVTTTAITANAQSRRDRDDVAALGVVEAGIATTVYRINELGPRRNECVVQDADGTLGTGPPEADGWCGWQSETLGDGEEWRTRASTASTTTAPCQTLQTRTVVSEGLAGDVWRRAIATVSTNTGAVFGTCGIISSLQFDGSNTANIHGSIATNGWADLDSSFRICGDVFGDRITKEPGVTIDCGGQEVLHPEGSTPFKLRKVKELCKDPSWAEPKPWSDPDCNDNGRITRNADPTDPTKDALVPDGESSVDWNEGENGEVDDPNGRVRERELRLSSKSTLTLSGNVYSFCYLKVKGKAKIYIAPRGPNKVVRIFIDSPENCPDQPITRSVFYVTDAGGTIVNTNPDPTTLQIYMIGTFDTGRQYGTAATMADYSRWDPNDAGSHTYENYVFYAPRSRVTIAGHRRILGAVAAKRVKVKSKASVIWSDEVAKLDSSNFGVTPSFTLDGWSECPPPQNPLDPTGILYDCADLSGG